MLFVAKFYDKNANPVGESEFEGTVDDAFDFERAGTGPGPKARALQKEHFPEADPELTFVVRIPE